MIGCIEQMKLCVECEYYKKEGVMGWHSCLHPNAERPGYTSPVTGEYERSKAGNCIEQRLNPSNISNKCGPEGKWWKKYDKRL